MDEEDSDGSYDVIVPSALRTQTKLVAAPKSSTEVEGGDGQSPKDLPIAGLRCSSFSTFFWSKDEASSIGGSWTQETTDRTRPKSKDGSEPFMSPLKSVASPC